MQISSKDLHYLSDEMSWQLIAFKKCHHYADEIQDQQIKNAVDKIGAMHQYHYEELLQYLQSSNGTSGQQGGQQSNLFTQ